MSTVVLSRRQAGALMRLLASHEENLESLIESHTVDGQVMPGDDADAAIVAEARREWREAEDLIMVVEPQVCRRRAS